MQKNYQKNAATAMTPVLPAAGACQCSGEQPVPSYQLFSQIEVPGRMAMQRMLAGLSTGGIRSGSNLLGSGSNSPRVRRASPR